MIKELLRTILVMSSTSWTKSIWLFEVMDANCILVYLKWLLLYWKINVGLLMQRIQNTEFRTNSDAKSRGKLRYLMIHEIFWFGLWESIELKTNKINVFYDLDILLVSFFTELKKVPMKWGWINLGQD